MSKNIKVPMGQNNNDRAESAVLSRDPGKALNEMMLTIDALRNVYAEETLALKAADTKAFFSLQDKKIESAQRYHDGFTEFVNRKAEMVAAHPDLKKMFGRKQEEFSKVAEENLQALERMHRVAGRLGQRIMDAARDNAAREGVAYGARGSMNVNRNKPVTTGLNESA